MSYIPQILEIQTILFYQILQCTRNQPLIIYLPILCICLYLLITLHVYVCIYVCVCINTHTCMHILHKHIKTERKNIKMLTYITSR